MDQKAEKVNGKAEAMREVAANVARDKGWRLGAVLPTDIVSRLLEVIVDGDGKSTELRDSLPCGLAAEWDDLEGAYEGLLIIAQALHLRAHAHLCVFQHVDYHKGIGEARAYARRASNLADDVMGYVEDVATLIFVQAEGGAK